MNSQYSYDYYYANNYYDTRDQAPTPVPTNDQYQNAYYYSGEGYYSHMNGQPEAYHNNYAQYNNGDNYNQYYCADAQVQQEGQFYNQKQGFYGHMNQNQQNHYSSYDQRYNNNYNNSYQGQGQSYYSNNNTGQYRY